MSEDKLESIKLVAKGYEAIIYNSSRCFLCLEQKEGLKLTLLGVKFDHEDKHYEHVGFPRCNSCGLMLQDPESHHLVPELVRDSLTALSAIGDLKIIPK